MTHTLTPSGEQVLVCLLSKGVEEKAARLMAAYSDLLLEANAVFNLTRITAPEEMAQKHFYDSLAPVLCDLLPQGAAVLDVGTGGGFPALPLAAARPDLCVTALDSNKKKVDFVGESAQRLGIPLTPLWGRGEELACGPLRESFDIVVSRAVAAMPMLVELCAPFLKVGGRLICYKGPGGREEARAAACGAGQLGLSKVKFIELPGEEDEHLLCVYEKKSPTPARFPRKFAQMKKKPL